MMDQLYAERPASWPNGLRVESFVPRMGENVYLVRTKEASTPIGFVGWQVRREGGQRVGYYSVGLMPEHRGHGYAKEAVAKLIQIKSAGVDSVKALVQKDNGKSIALAQALGVPVIKVANVLGNMSEAAGRVSNVVPKVDQAADRIISTTDRLNATQDLLKTLGLGGAGAALGHTAAELALDDVAPNHPHYQRNRRLKLLAAILGGAAGSGVARFNSK